MYSININVYAKNLIKKEGIFFSKNISKISYPTDGNDIYFLRINIKNNI